MSLSGRVVGVAALCLGVVAPLGAQEPARPRQLSAQETGCDSTRPAPSDPVYQADSVDRVARTPYVRVSELPFHMREVQTGRTMLQFVVDPEGRVERCSIALVEESSPEWTAAVLPELRQARFDPARKAGRKVRQLVYQVFTYHSDGRAAVSQ
jgi:outer membrane biosynthesis protein TonB